MVITPLGNLLVGPLAAGVGIQAALLLLATICGVPLAIVAFVPSVRAIRGLRTTDSADQTATSSDPAFTTQGVSL